jgi:hypothetical protein
MTLLLLSSQEKNGVFVSSKNNNLIDRVINLITDQLKMELVHLTDLIDSVDLTSKSKQTVIADFLLRLRSFYLFFEKAANRIDSKDSPNVRGLPVAQRTLDLLHRWNQTFRTIQDDELVVVLRDLIDSTLLWHTQYVSTIDLLRKIMQYDSELLTDIFLYDLDQDVKPTFLQLIINRPERYRKHVGSIFAIWVKALEACKDPLNVMHFLLHQSTLKSYAIKRSGDDVCFIPANTSVWKNAISNMMLDHNKQIHDRLYDHAFIILEEIPVALPVESPCEFLGGNGSGAQNYADLIDFYLSHVPKPESQYEKFIWRETIQALLLHTTNHHQPRQTGLRIESVFHQALRANVPPRLVCGVICCFPSHVIIDMDTDMSMNPLTGKEESLRCSLQQQQGYTTQKSAIAQASYRQFLQNQQKYTLLNKCLHFVPTVLQAVIFEYVFLDHKNLAERLARDLRF